MRVSIKDRPARFNDEEYKVSGTQTTGAWVIDVFKDDKLILSTTMIDDPDIDLDPVEVVANAIEDGLLSADVIPEYNTNTEMYVIKRHDGTILVGGMTRNQCQDLCRDDPVIAMFTERLNELDPHNPREEAEIRSIRAVLQGLHEIL